MAFVDNPTISALGSAIGLGPLFNTASNGAASPSAPTPGAPTNLFAQGPTAADNSQELAQNIQPPKPTAPAHSAQNVPIYKGRPYLPHIIGNQGGSGGVRPGAGVQTTPGVMDPATLQSPEVQALLKSYGVTPTTAAPDPNLFIHNANAFQRHPVAAGLLERGLEGAANMHVGDNFLDSFSGTLKGNQEAQAQRAQQANAQTMAPINQALAVQSLLHGKQQMDLETQKANDDKDYHDGLINHYASMDMTRGERAAAIPPRFDKQGRPYYYTEDPDTHKPSWEPDKNWTPDPRTAMSQALYDRESKSLQTKYPSDDPHDPYKNVPPQELEDAYNKLTSQQYYDQSAGTRSVANINGQSRIAAAGVRGANGTGGYKMSDVDKRELGQLDKDDAVHNKVISEAGNPNNMRVLDPATGQLIVADVHNPDYATYTKRHSDALATNAARRRQIMQKYQNGAPNVQPPVGPQPTQSSPAPGGAVSNNPFRHNG